MLNIVLHEPEIPHNTGAIARTCALTNTRLHLIKPFMFDISEKAIRRAGLDYWPLVTVKIHESFDEFLEKEKPKEIYLATTKTERLYTDVNYSDESYLVFGKESKGLPIEILNRFKETQIKIPMISELKRSLNLANSTNIILYEALRQLNFPFR